MKRLLTASILAMTAALTWCQPALSLDTLLNNHREDVIVVKGIAADEMGLDLYRSLVATDTCLMSEMERTVRRDGAQATDKDVIYRDGHLYYGFYTFSAIADPRKPKRRLNRYVFYIDRRLDPQPQAEVTAVYLETDLNARCVKRIFKQNNTSKR